ncbi:hypothetical protein T12_9904 [Trichinella patagoniensis]|uniref:Uncharacterized protein n=1 Tax=Trichinella patagoniensis TaxID=990121 RepID=A0A0V1AFU2_9BILA|nr:hypothetical protein T12_9904 [Trichinella patagoniensis]
MGKKDRWKKANRYKYNLLAISAIDGQPASATFVNFLFHLHNVKLASPKAKVVASRRLVIKKRRLLNFFPSGEKLCLDGQ